MARMLPDHVLDPERSAAENRLFRKIRHETPDDWWAIHSQGVAHHPNKPWAEIDFLLITDVGVWCIEVKGGLIEHREGCWYTNGHPLSQSPFAQAGGASAALYDFLKERVQEIRKAIVGWGVAFPDTRFTARGAEIEPELIYDDDDLERRFEDYVGRVADHWRGRLTAMRPRAFSPLTPAERRRILHAIAPDFRFVPTLRSAVREVEEEMVRLTEQQAEVLRGMEECERVLIKGGAGTGKTILALQEARRLAAEGRKTLLCCYSQHLANDLRRRTPEEVDVHHFHGLLSSLIREADLLEQLPDVHERDLFDVFQPQFAIEALEQLDRLGRYDALVIDETQDLMKESYLLVLDALVRGELQNGIWRFFHDPNQDRFAASDLSVLDQLEAYADCRYRLTVNCRNTRQIAVTTALLTTLPSSEALKADGPEIVELWFGTQSDQAKLAKRQIEAWLAGELRPDQIAVLSPRRMEHSVISQLTGRPSGREVVDLTARERADNEIGFSTIAGFKGLEADAVLLVDLTDLESASALLDVYIGASRAKAVLALALSGELREIYRHRAEDFAARIAADVL
jgi:hypothetical protein